MTVGISEIGTLPDLYLRAQNGRYTKLPNPLVLASVKFNGQSITDGFDVALSGHLADVDADKIVFAVTKGITDILDLFNRVDEKMRELKAQIKAQEGREHA